MSFVSVETFHNFLKYYSKRRYSKGEVILQQDESTRLIFVVGNGIVKTYNLTVSGEEKPITFKLKNAVFPLSSLFSLTNNTLYYYEALTDCELYVVPADDYVFFLKSNPDFLFQTLHNVIDNTIECEMRINALEQSKAKDKVLVTLQFLVQRFGRTLGTSWVEIQLPFTQQDMANFMGLARETAAIELKKLERNNVISYHHRKYMIDTFKLKELLGENYDTSYRFEPLNSYKIAFRLVDKIKNAYGKTYK